MYECYNHATLKIKHVKADSVAIKGQHIAVKLYNLVNGVVQIDTADYQPGQYAVQFFKENQVIEQSVLKVKQNLKYVDVNYDPRTPNQIILEAINAYLGGRASTQQRRVQVGDKSIEYSSYDQLMKWRDFYAAEVRKEQGKSAGLRFEKLYYKGI